MGRGTIILNPGTFSNPVQFTDGTAGSPSLTFSSDPDTGFFWQSSGSFAATNNGTGVWSFQTGGLAPVTDNTFNIGDSTHRVNIIDAHFLRIYQSVSANPVMGVVTLSGGTGTAIAYTTAVAANCRIFLTHQNASGTTGTARVTASTNGVGFTIVSSSSTDTSTIAWFLFQAT